MHPASDTATNPPSSQASGSGGLAALWTGARNPPAEDAATRFDGQTVLIVGATAGVGHEAAVKIASRGAARLIIGARDMARAEKTGAAIVARSSLPAEAIDLYHVDFASFTSIRGFVRDLERRAPLIHTILISAGIGSPHYRTCETGWESMLQVNTLGTALCTILLMPLLRLTGAALGRPATLGVVGSEAYLEVQEDWLPKDETILDHYNKKANFTLDRQYHIGKLLVMFVQQGIIKAAETKPHAPSIVICSPGMCRTEMGRDFPLSMRLFMAVFQFFLARSAEEGSRSLVSGLALGAKGSGHFWTNDALDSRQPLLKATSWERAQTAEFARIMDVLEQACPGAHAALTS